MVRPLVRADYEPTWEAMRRFTADRTEDAADELWWVEHPPVYTLGQAGKREHLLAENGIPLVQTDRGGQITYHGPGQVIAYPLIDLKRRHLFVKEYVRRLEQSVIDCLETYNVRAERMPGAPGVYVAWQGALAKIAALGLKLRQGRSYHGIALNVAMDLRPFSDINPCGYPDLRAVDLATLGVEVGLQDVATEWTRHLKRHLED